MERKQPVYLTTADLMARWHCCYRTAIAFMHRKDSGAIKPSKLLLIDERKVIAYENAREVV